jgi:DNA ligase-1
MDYSTLADAYEALEQTTKRLEMVDILADLFARTPKEVIDRVIYLTQGKVLPDFYGVELGVGEKLAIRAIAQATGASASEVEALYKKTGDLGLVAETFTAKKTQLSLFSNPLTVERVYDTLHKIATRAGKGSIDLKLRYLQSLLGDATPKEAKYVMRTVMGQLRLGIADYTVLDALAQAYTGSKDNRPHLERAYNLSSDLGAVARAVAEDGLEGVKQFRVTVGRPIRPMLAERLTTAEEALEKLGGRCAAEYKLDGERLQIHIVGHDITLFSRRLENITHHFPDVLELCREHVKVKEAILEAEAVAINEDTGEYLPFQELMHRRRKYGVEEAMKLYPVALNFFDILYLEGEDYTPQPYHVRRSRLEEVVASDERIRPVPQIVAEDAGRLEAFMEEAIAEGCEGIMVKDLDSPYRAGAREFAWIKLKREYRSELTDTLDLVIVGAFYGRGRRAGRYGTFLLAAYDHEADVFRTVCKVGTGFSDEDLERFPELLKPYLIRSKHPRVDSKMEADLWFEPKMVIEIIASEITLSPVHTCALGVVRPNSGLALRFPKFTGRIRDDKGPEDATTVKEVVEMYRRQLKRIEEPGLVRSA